MHIVWTTVSTPAEAEGVAVAVINQRLAVCVQADGPITSHYLWAGQRERAQEVRLWFKCTGAQLAALETFVLSQHPYDIPQWIVVRAEHVGEKYLSWAQASSSTRPL